MKNIQKITRVQLEVNQKDEFILFGIVSAEPDYKLSLILNKKFRISLKNKTPLRITDDNGIEMAFSSFSDFNGSPDIIFTLISNRSGKNFLIKKLKNIDYIFQIRDPDSKKNIGHFTSSLREIETITAVFNIELNTIKDRNLLYLIQ